MGPVDELAAKMRLVSLSQELLQHLSRLDVRESFRWVGPWRVQRAYTLGVRLARAAFAVDPSLRGDA